MPKKFGIDKRKLHYSALILSNQISRKDALIKLKEPIYPIDKIEIDKKYFRKKLDLNQTEFDEILENKPKIFSNYPNNSFYHNFLKKVLSLLRKKRLFYS